MAKAADDRYQSADEMRRDLLGYLGSVGENVDSAAFKTAPDPAASGVAPVGGAEHATRKQIEQYERRLRQRGALGWLTLLLLVIGVGVGAVYVYQRFVPTEEPVATAEAEPNGEPEQANPLPEGLVLTGLLGRRTSEMMSDADVYRVDNPGGDRAFVRISVSGIPNMDIVVDLVKAGHREPVLSADGAGVGQPELVPAFPIRGSDYFIRVRERWMAGQRATENVSDEYTVQWAFVTPEEHEEHEVNDSLELADTIGAGESRKGHIGWGGDVDSYCLSENAPGSVASVTAVPGVDLVLRIVDRVAARSFKLDAAGVGVGELSQTLETAEQGRTCFIVEADDTEEGAARSNPTVPYTLTVRPAATDAPPAPGEQP
jgi:hypothetical protein